MSYIQNYKDFWSLRFTVTKDTLIPRPETELIIDTALKLFPDKKAEFNILDLGTGNYFLQVLCYYRKWCTIIKSVI